MTMTAVTEQIAEIAKRLPPSERARLVDELLASLDQPNQTLDELWRQECQARLKALEKGEMPWEDFDQVLTDLRQS
ncbi:MAG: addiction module protein [Hydrogenophilus thermoluteolus]|nr:addiction module protein [Hydrogenophilus thermoluteolus]MBW7657410.1 addiction module protein [Hydrogenophilus thermoluteolus]